MRRETIEKQKLLTAQKLRSLLSYDSDTGKFLNKIKRKGVAIGTEAGYINNYGYLVIEISRMPYQAHRLAWLYMTGEWPVELIDHENGNKSDNSWSNLRPASYAQNNANSKTSSRNRSGQRGVLFIEKDNLWRAQLNKNGKPVHLSWHKTFENAKAAYLTASFQHHGEFRKNAKKEK